MGLADSRSRIRRLCRVAAERHLPLLVTIAILCLAFGTGYTWVLDRAPVESREYFGRQAEAFLHGRTDLDVPSAQLDMSEFGGKIYLYWGPGNALPHLLARVAMGRDLSVCLWTVLFAVLSVALFGASLVHLERRLFPDAPGWIATGTLITFALGTPLFVVAAWSASPHHESIALSTFAQGLVFLTLLREIERHTWLRSAALALSLAFALSTRVSLLFLLPGLLAGALTVLPAPRIREALRLAGLPALGVGLTLAGLMLFNRARFGDPFETGMRYATGWAEQRELLYAHGALVSPRWIPTNVWQYFLHLPAWHAGLPRPAWSESLAVPAGLRDLFPPGQPMSVETHSVLFMTPFLLAALLLALPSRGAGADPARRTGAMFALAAAGMILFLLCYAWTSRRFTLDFLPAWLLAAFIAFHRHQRDHPRHAPALQIFLALTTVWSVALHWQLAEIGARRVSALMLLADAAPLASPTWPAVLAALLGLGVLADLGLQRLRTQGRSSAVGP
jgi:hypothetical protein